MKRNALCAISIFFALFVLIGAGCIKKAKTHKMVNIEVQMFSGPEHQAMIPTAQYWNEHYSEKTGIIVKVVELDRVGYFGKMETQLIAGMSVPDIVHPFSLHLGRLKSYLEPLDDYLKKDKIMISPTGKRLNLGEMLDVALKTVASSDGKIYMIPKDMSEVILYYRKDLISNPPQTWDEYVELAKQFTESINPESPTQYGTVMQGKYEMWTFCAALENIWPNGGSIFIPGTTKPNFDNQGTILGLRVYEELSKSGVFPPEALDAEHPEVAAVIASGKVAMAMQWNAFYPEFLVHKEKADKAYGKFDIAAPPGVEQPDGSIRRDMYVQTICLAVNKKSKNKEEAMKFLVWATLGEGAVIYAKAGGSSPIKAIWKAKDVKLPYSRLAPWVEDFGRSVPEHSDLVDIMMIGSNWIQKVMAQKATSQEAAKGLNEEIINYLADK